MKKNIFLLFCIFLAVMTQAQHTHQFGRAPLKQNPYAGLPLGSVSPQGWLKEMLVRQAKGATGRLDELYPLVMDKRNGWLGGDGDQWERGPYWIDGLLPLAYILKDKELIAKTKPWIEWALNSQRPDGYFGPSKDYGPEPGVQRNNSQDWWPKMVMLKILMQYYSATEDTRVVSLMTNYFKYQLKTLPQQPLDHWTFWARYRGGDNLMAVYWLYNITGDDFLLELGDLIYKQTFDYTNAFLNTSLLSTMGSIHCVNLAQGIKTPMIYYQRHNDPKYIQATEKGFKDLVRFNGHANGMYGGDEALHGNNPTQGSEFCSAVELMFSLENILAITGGVSYADHLEKIAFNTLPAQASDDFMTRQYFQQANQVMATRHIRNFDVNHEGTDVVYGLMTGYPCCTANMHQGWPKFTQNLWYATPDKGLAALVYAPSEVKAIVAGETEVIVKEETSYPFEDEIRFVFSFPKKAKHVTFPFHLRVPGWCKEAVVYVNGMPEQKAAGGSIIVLNRNWNNGDVVTLKLPMHIYKNTWHENSVSIQRGPLVYALKIGERVEKVQNKKDAGKYGETYYEIHPTTPWNYGLLNIPEHELEKAFQLQVNPVTAYPWNLQNAPLTLQTKARRIPSWQLYNQMAGPLPYSMIYQLETAPDDEDIILVPYGCTQLRISQFPVVGR